MATCSRLASRGVVARETDRTLGGSDTISEPSFFIRKSGLPRANALIALENPPERSPLPDSPPNSKARIAKVMRAFSLGLMGRLRNRLSDQRAVSIKSIAQRQPPSTIS